MSSLGKVDVSSCAQIRLPDCRILVTGAGVASVEIHKLLKETEESKVKGGEGKEEFVFCFCSCGLEGLCGLAGSSNLISSGVRVLLFFLFHFGGFRQSQGRGPPHRFYHYCRQSSAWFLLLLLLFASLHFRLRTTLQDLRPVQSELRKSSGWQSGSGR